MNSASGLGSGEVNKAPESTAPNRLLAAPDFQERPRVRSDGFRDGVAIDELPFAAADDKPSFGQNLEMV